jgi:small subunit ribosomal protein S20
VANHPSARKRNRQSANRSEANHSVRTMVRTLVRKCTEAVASGDKEKAREALGRAQVALSKAASKGILHRNNASRRTSRLAQKVAQMGD